jgi:hypothetical protein
MASFSKRHKKSEEKTHAKEDREESPKAQASQAPAKGRLQSSCV